MTTADVLLSVEDRRRSVERCPRPGRLLTSRRDGYLGCLCLELGTAADATATSVSSIARPRLSISQQPPSELANRAERMLRTRTWSASRIVHELTTDAVIISGRTVTATTRRAPGLLAR